MKNKFTISILCPCPIYKIRMDPNSYDKEKILKDILYNKGLKNTRNDTKNNVNCDIHHSYQDFDNEDFRIINYDKLVVVYQEIFQNFFDKKIAMQKTCGWVFEIVNYTAVTEGQWFALHNHCPTDDFAAVHYLNFKDDHTPTIFNNPQNFAPFLKYMRPELFNALDEEDPDNQYMWEQFAWKVKEDDMLIFPSALDHEVGTQGPTKEPRITIAANLKLLSQEEK